MEKQALQHLREDLTVSTELLGHSMVFNTTWGLFSPRAVDEGSLLLLEYIRFAENSRFLDLGCGYGALGLSLAKSAPQGSAHLIDKDFVAIEYTKKNAALNHIANAEIYLSNGLNQVPSEARFDCVVSNLPAKSGKEMYYLYFHDIRDRLDAGGEFYIVTINGLRTFVKRVFGEVFGNYEKLKQGKTYTVARAVVDQGFAG